MIPRFSHVSPKNMVFFSYSTHMKEPQKPDSPGTEVHHPKPLQRHPAKSMGLGFPHGINELLYLEISNR